MQNHRLKHRWQPLAVREKSICVRSMNAESACGVRWLPFCSWEGLSVCWCRCDGGVGWWRWLGWRYWGCGSWGNIGGSWERGGKTCREVLERRVGSCTFTCLDILETWGSFMKEIQKNEWKDDRGGDMKIIRVPSSTMTRTEMTHTHTQNYW